MNFIACDGVWLHGGSGLPECNGVLHSVAGNEMRDLSGAALNWEQVSELQGEVMLLFAIVFGFLVLKKLL
ncbi:hypothetical protein [Stutzerimonas nitrititolerans]|uniref:hypothetical protein n=1 Tax=Stutzerimonas nitrititolerans TaxID=2482751 RepID=UPI0028AEEBEE|nr:hypothetical protein [Stutzerimonas nitrititolerans]